MTYGKMVSQIEKRIGEESLKLISLDIRLYNPRDYLNFDLFELYKQLKWNIRLLNDELENVLNDMALNKKGLLDEIVF